MPKVNADAMHVAVPGMVDSYEQEVGGFTVTKETWSIDMDFAFAYKGLPDDMCQASHVGYVASGAMTLRGADGTDEVFEAGDAFVVGPGHIPSVVAGTEIIVFTPVDEARPQADIIAANMMRNAEEKGITIPT